MIGHSRLLPPPASRQTPRVRSGDAAAAAHNTGLPYSVKRDLRKIYPDYPKGFARAVAFSGRVTTGGLVGWMSDAAARMTGSDLPAELAEEAGHRTRLLP
jgi:hypothetical protein